MLKAIKSIDLLMLSLMILSLPSIEAPKNIFLVGYLFTRVFIESYKLSQNIKQWSSWDSLFLTIVFTAFLSTLFAGMSNLEEWKGFRVFLTAILTGWFLSRADYTNENYRGLFKLIVLGSIPPLAWGLYEYLIIHSRKTLEIHSVGHVNHSAIYLTMIFGASLCWFLSQLNFKEEKENLKWKTILLGVLSLIFFICLIIGESRGAFGVAAILGLSIFVLAAKNTKIKILGGVSIITIILLAIILKASIIQKQIYNQEANNTLGSRDKVWNVSIEASRFYPLLGIGMSNWHFISVDQLKKSVEARGEIFNRDIYAFPGHSHNFYLTALVERGMVGLVVTFIFMIAWARQLAQTFKLVKKSSEATYLWGGSLSAWVATFGIGFVNTTFHHEHAILACLFLGLYLSYTNVFLKKKIGRKFFVPDVNTIYKL